MSLLPWICFLDSSTYVFGGSCQTEGKGFSPISATIPREGFLSCNRGGGRMSQMNNWWCEMDGFLSVEGWSNPVLYYLEWEVCCVLSSNPLFFIFNLLLCSGYQNLYIWGKRALLYFQMDNSNNGRIKKISTAATHIVVSVLDYNISVRLCTVYKYVSTQDCPLMLEYKFSPLEEELLSFFCFVFVYYCDNRKWFFWVNYLLNIINYELFFCLFFFHHLDY